ncbi:BlaI/MecI/CopY family transcriptional regulator [uncultured Pseudoflavonifractor sp.]|uniref:BlaI/MecI/CopY family transcriptional regulator n=1 Tax=uncultured Pseudoflavonifractor sp. TaxID=1221379 RepID=UPI0025E63B5F|nr:BlaI/MecI/CopY family transcriptional regulator [uncultured Pseudoflavonifractor sp.]
MERVNLSAGEWRVMEELWKAPATLMELVRALGESAGWAKSTVSTVVRRMEDKGLIRAEQEGRAKVFYPAIAREEAAAAETESLLSRVYHGSVGLMVSTLLQNRRISREELKELQMLLEQGEEEQT